MSVETGPGQVQGTDTKINDIGYVLSAFWRQEKLQRGRRHEGRGHNTGGGEAQPGSEAGCGHGAAWLSSQRLSPCPAQSWSMPSVCHFEK